jgi:hypothetical protein
MLSYVILFHCQQEMNKTIPVQGFSHKAIIKPRPRLESQTLYAR